MSKCEKCTHLEVCKSVEKMKKFETEIAEKMRLLEYAGFSAKVDCKYYHATEAWGKR